MYKLLNNEDLTIYGDGSQSRSFCYVDDLVDGLIKLMNLITKKPVNLGNPDEFSILELAELIKNKINPKLNFCYKDLPQDDPIQRRPVISVAEKHCNWHPKNQTR